MPKKAEITEPMSSDDDDELEYVAPLTVTKKANAKKQLAPQIPAQPVAELTTNLATNLATNLPTKPKQKRNISEAQKEVLRERLKVAHARKKELADARKALREEEEQNHLAQKQIALLEQARLIKQKHKNELKAIKSTPVEPVAKSKKQKVVYVEESSSEEEEQVVVVKKQKKTKNTNKKEEAIEYQQPIEQPIQSSFQFRFL